MEKNKNISQIVYITFDPYYTILEYNSFLENLNNNKVAFKEYVYIKPPYNFYIGIDKKYLPVFLKFDIAPSNVEKFLLEKLIPRMPNDQWFLTRKVSDTPGVFEKFISPNIFKDVKYSEYACIFRYRNKEQLVQISRELNIPIYVLGKHREWNLAFTFNKFIKGYIPLDWILVEKKKPTDFNKAGEFESYLNIYKLVKTKLTMKAIDYPYYDNGKYYPLKTI